MPSYGEADYWDKRYERDADEPFDWLFSYGELADALSALITPKDVEILIIGCGNASFSPDMYSSGFTNITNVDISSVVIEQQATKYPGMQWKTMDVLNMSFVDNTFAVVIDKSLIDTLLCGTHSIENTQGMIEEVHRVLQPGGRYITLSLHDTIEVMPHFEPFKAANKLHIDAYRMKSNRWNAGEHRRRATAHSMIIAEKTPLHSLFPPSSLSDLVLSGQQYKALKARASQINFTAALAQFDDLQVRSLLLRLLHSSGQKKKDKNSDSNSNHKHVRERAFMESYCQAVAKEAKNTLLGLSDDS